jgi:hypothetical protein
MRPARRSFEVFELAPHPVEAASQDAMVEAVEQRHHQPARDRPGGTR